MAHPHGLICANASESKDPGAGGIPGSLGIPGGCPGSPGGSPGSPGGRPGKPGAPGSPPARPGGSWRPGGGGGNFKPSKPPPALGSTPGKAAKAQSFCKVDSGWGEVEKVSEVW